MTSLHPGSLLVAVPGVLEDPNFRRTVVLLLEHGEHGALGVVLNRPTDTPLLDPFPAWHDLVTAPPVVFDGGPVSQQMVIALGRPRAGLEPDGWNRVLAIAGTTLGTVDLRHETHDLATDFEEVRVFAGYAGWAAGQLEDEVAAGAWFVVGAEAGDAFSPRPGELWQTILRRQRGVTAYYALYPADPSLN